jgi:protein TonB
MECENMLLPERRDMHMNGFPCVMDNDTTYLSSCCVSVALHLLLLFALGAAYYFHPCETRRAQLPIEVGLIVSAEEGRGEKAVAVKTRNRAKSGDVKEAAHAPSKSVNRVAASEKNALKTAVPPEKPGQPSKDAPAPSPGGGGADSVTVRAGGGEGKSSAITGSPVQEIQPDGGASFGTGFVSGSRPVYPEEARKSGRQGVVVVRVTVDADGTPENAAILKSSGFSGFDQEALRTVRKWKFRPALLRGRAVKAFHDVRVKFRIEE